MRLSPRFAPLALALLLSACATFTEAELGTIRQRGVAPGVVAKLAHERVLLPEEVIELSRRGVPDPLIMRQIDEVGVDYLLTEDDYYRLKKARVSPPVIDALVVASNDFARLYSARLEEDIYVEDPGPIHGSIGIGFSSGGYGRHRHP